MNKEKAQLAQDQEESVVYGEDREADAVCLPDLEQGAVYLPQTPGDEEMVLFADPEVYAVRLLDPYEVGEELPGPEDGERPVDQDPCV